MTMEELDAWLKANPAPASSDEVLALEPNTVEKAQSGPTETVSSTAYVEMTKPDGSIYLAAKSSQEYFEGLGYTAGAEQEIDDLNAWLDERSKSEPAAPAEPAAPPA